MYKAVKKGLVDPSRSIQVGIRTHNDLDMGFHVIDAREVHESKPSDIAQKIKGILGDHPTYLTFDIDCLDPAFAPDGDARLGWAKFGAGGHHFARYCGYKPDRRGYC